MKRFSRFFVLLYQRWVSKCLGPLTFSRTVTACRCRSRAQSPLVFLSTLQLSNSSTDNCSAKVPNRKSLVRVQWFLGGRGGGGWGGVRLSPEDKFCITIGRRYETAEIFFPRHINQTNDDSHKTRPKHLSEYIPVNSGVEVFKILWKCVLSCVLTIFVLSKR